MPVVINEYRDERTTPNTILTATRTLAINRHLAWTVRQEVDGSFCLIHSTSTNNRDWSPSALSRDFLSWQEAVTSDPELIALRSGQPTAFTIDGVENQLSLASLLTFIDTDGNEPGYRKRSYVGTIANRPISFYPRPDDGEFIAAVGECNSFDEEDFLGDLVAKCYWREMWQNEDGTDEYDDPMPLTYGRALVEVSPGTCVNYPLDEDAISDEPAVIVLTSDPNVRAAGLLEWIKAVQISAESSALTLEPLDPDGHLSAEQRFEWEEAFEDPRFSLEYHLDLATSTALRTQLAEDPNYRKVRTSLSNPLSESGQRLLHALQQSYEPPGHP